MNSTDIIHKWANRQIETRKYSNTIHATKNELYHRNTLVARHIGLWTFIKIYYVRGGYDTYTITNSIPFNKRKHMYIVKHIPTLDTLESEENFIHWFSNEVSQTVTDILENVSYLHEFAINNRMYVERYWDYNKICYSSIAPNKYIRKYIKSINNLEYKGKYSKKIWQSWSKYSITPSIEISCKLKDIANKVKFNKLLPKAILKQLEFKRWYVKYAKGDITIQAAEKIYNNSEKRIAREKLHIEQEKRKAINLAKEAILRNQKQIKAYFERLHAWKLNTSARNIMKPYTLNILLPDDIKLEGTRVITTLGVIIPLEEAKKAFLLFKRYSSDTYADIPIKGATIADYTVLGIFWKTVTRVIKDEITPNSEMCLIVGCHVIPASAIYDFIKRYNLSW